MSILSIIKRSKREKITYMTIQTCLFHFCALFSSFWTLFTEVKIDFVKIRKIFGIFGTHLGHHDDLGVGVVIFNDRGADGGRGHRGHREQGIRVETAPRVIVLENRKFGICFDSESNLFWFREFSKLYYRKTCLVRKIFKSWLRKA